MKKILFSFLVVAAIAAAPSKVLAQSNSTNTVSAVEIVNPMTLTQSFPMAFGKIGVTATTGGTATLGTDGVVTVSGLTKQGGTSTSATYEASGDANRTYAVTLPATISVVYASTTLTINNIKAKCGTGSDQIQQAISVGGTLTVAAGTLGATYTGSFQISIDYN